jgi:hypothetical protein
MRGAAGGQRLSGPALHPDQSLDTALQMFGDRPMLPVVSRRDAAMVLGELHLADVLRAYGINAPVSGSEPSVRPNGVDEERPGG